MMSDFINTIDVLGDEAVVDSVIDRSITEFKDDKLTTVGKYAFNGCTSLVTVSLPLVEDIYGSVFANCTALETLDVPKLKYIRNGEFKNLKALKSVYFPDATIGTEVNPGMSAFQGCSALVSAHLPKLQEIPAYFFYGTALDSAVFPSVTKIGNYGFTLTKGKWYSFPSCTEIKGSLTFVECYNLIALVLGNTESVVTLERANVFDGAGYKTTPIQGGTGYIYVPRALVDSYKSATNWATFADQFRALEDYTVDGTTTGELDETKI